MSDCLFCQIIAEEIPSTTVSATGRTIAFLDIDPRAPVHVIVVPREHLPNVAALSADAGLLQELVAHAAAIANAEGIAEGGWRLVFDTGAHAGQTVFHVHAHVLGGAQLGRLGV